MIWLYILILWKFWFYLKVDSNFITTGCVIGVRERPADSSKQGWRIPAFIKNFRPSGSTVRFFRALKMACCNLTSLIKGAWWFCSACISAGAKSWITFWQFSLEQHKFPMQSAAVTFNGWSSPFCSQSKNETRIKKM